MTQTIYATLNVAGQPVEVSFGFPFSTHSILITEEGESAWSFTAIGQRAPFEVAHGPGALVNYSAADLARYGIQKREISDPPTGKQLTSYALRVVNGVIAVTPTWQNTPAPPVPSTVSRMQAKLALDAAGILDAVEAAVSAAPRAVQIYWAEVSEIHRDHPILATVTAGLGLTSTQVDDLFRAAAAIS